jgi:hypothetical protein
MPIHGSAQRRQTLSKCFRAVAGPTLFISGANSPFQDVASLAASGDKTNVYRMFRLGRASNQPTRDNHTLNTF